MEKLLISGCFLGEKVRYDGADNRLADSVITRWQQQNRLIVICPEISGGLPVPRAPAEIQTHGHEHKVITVQGEDVSECFQQGAANALALCKKNHIRYALLKESSPSCGGLHIYDGSFSGVKIPGAGITTQLLRENGIQVYSEKNLATLIAIFD